MKRELIFLLLIMATILANGQEWIQKYEGQSIRTFTPTLADNYVLVGSKFLGMAERFFFFQANAQGIIQWDSAFTSSYETGIAEHVLPTRDSGYIIANNYADSVRFWRFDMNNTLLWRIAIQRPEPYWIETIYSVIETDDGGILAAGTTYESNEGSCIIRLNSDGDSLWTKSYPENIQCWALASASDKTGYFCTVWKSNTSALMKIDLQGDTIWTKPFIDNSAELMVPTSDSNLVIAGKDDDNNIVITKVNSEGEQIWEKKYHERFTYNVCYHISETKDGGFITTNSSRTGVSSIGWIMKLDANGDSIFTIKPKERLYLSDIYQTEDGMYVFLANNQDGPMLIKCDSTGNILNSLYLKNSVLKNIDIHPNPVKDELILQLDTNTLPEGTICIYHISGALFRQERLKRNTSKLNVAKLERGVYILKIRLGKEVISKVFIKE